MFYIGLFFIMSVNKEGMLPSSVNSELTIVPSGIRTALISVGTCIIAKAFVGKATQHKVATNIVSSSHRCLMLLLSELVCVCRIPTSLFFFRTLETAVLLNFHLIAVFCCYICSKHLVKNRCLVKAIRKNNSVVIGISSKLLHHINPLSVHK